MDEERESKRIWWIAGVVLLAVVAFRFIPTIHNPLAPRPEAAYVTLRAAGDAVASDGKHELAAGRDFQLFAVVAAKTWTGSEVYFTDAPEVRLGGKEIPAQRLRRWPDGRIVRLRWFSVEGSTPYVNVKQAKDLDRFSLIETFHPEWGNGWSVKGVIDPTLVQLDPASPLRPLPFGVQRYAVRVELFDAPGSLVPARRIESPGPSAFAGGEPNATRALAALPAPLALLSRSFGLTEIESAPDLPPALEKKIEEWKARGLVFARTRLLAEHVEDAGQSPAALVWRTLDLDKTHPVWGREAGPGDLLQVGSRVVVLYRDEGEPGRLDPRDLVFDLWKGLHIHRIADIFTSHDGLELSFAHLGS